MKLFTKIKQDIKDFKEADKFVKSELDTDEEIKDDKIARISLLCLGVVLLVLFGVIIVSINMPIKKIYKTYSNLDNPEEIIKENNSNSDNPYISGNNNNDTFKSYKIGDVVTLKDNSKWYVIDNSSGDEAYISLLSTNNINDGTINYMNAEEYLETTYKNKLVSSLKIDKESITVRLISLNDISILSGIKEEELDVNSQIQNNKTPKFVYETINMTNHTDEENKPVLICPNNGNAILCSGNPPLDPWIIKPVIELSKDDIK